MPRPDNAWRDELLALVEPAPELPLHDPRPFADRTYEPRQAVRWGVGETRSRPLVLAWWDFGVLGGSFGEADATALSDAVDAAVEHGATLVTLLASGGTRLQEGMAALVGIPRARLALRRLAEAGRPHLAVCDQPTMGGVWIGVGSRADLRVTVRGSVVGFAGPRVVEAITGTSPGPHSHSADAALAAGLVDAVVDRDEVVDLVGRAVLCLVPGGRKSRVLHPPPVEPARVSGADAVAAPRARTRGGRALLDALGEPAVDLVAPHADPSVVARLMTVAHRPVVAVALAAERGGRPTPNGFRLLTRAADLADRIGLPLLCLVDTPGADPGEHSESDGIAAAICEAMDAVLACRSLTVAVVHGEGGSGGALAGAVTDVVLVTTDCYFAALGPDGAAAVLHNDVADAADLMGITPAHLIAGGFADRLVEPDRVAAAVGAALTAEHGDDRLAVRTGRWSAPLPHRPGSHRSPPGRSGTVTMHGPEITGGSQPA